MYRNKLSALFSVVSASSLMSVSNSSLAMANLSSNLQSYNDAYKSIIVKNENELISALNDHSINDIIIEGNVTLFKNIDLSTSPRKVRITVGSENCKDSSLVIIQGCKIFGDNKLIFEKNNDTNKAMIEFRRVASMSDNSSQTALKEVMFTSNEGEYFLDNTLGNLNVENCIIENGTLFTQESSYGNVKSSYFINSQLDDGHGKYLGIKEESVESQRNSISFSGYGNQNYDYVAVAVDEEGKIFKSEKLVLNRRGEFKGTIENLDQAKKYDLYVAQLDQDGSLKNVILSKPIEVNTLKFKTSIKEEDVNNVKIKIEENDLPSEYYPLYLILKLDGNVFKKVELPKHENLVLNITGLKENLQYTYQIVSYGKTSEMIVDDGEFRTKKSSSSDQENSTSIVYYTISDQDLAKSKIRDTEVEIYLNTSINNVVNGADKFKVNIDGLEAELLNNKLVVSKLLPSKSYENLKIYFDTSDGKRVVLSVPEFTTLSNTNDINKFVRSVYYNAFNRNPDEKGFWYWVDSLKSKSVSFEYFVRNLLFEDEFLSKRPSTKEKIEGLYQVIVNRKSDKEGLAYWIHKYETFIAKGCSEEFSFRIVVDNMINENEFKNIVSSLENSIRIA